MNLAKLLGVVQSRVPNSAERKRISDLAKRLVTGFESNHADGVRAELAKDYEQLSRKHAECTKAVRRSAGI